MIEKPNLKQVNTLGFKKKLYNYSTICVAYVKTELKKIEDLQEE